VVDAENAAGAAALHLQRVEAAVAADVEHAAAGEILGHGGLEAAPLDRRIIAEKMLGRGFDPAQVDVVEPRPERGHFAPDLVR
jgi:hypothetical protein